ncbi:MAG: hypothetical protein J6386_09825 [Candidatus Synoicihabitans palmerolidicus]|nr:hypothetical protein [Candidatus Synoicihabitans palmerolidicus]
MPESAAIKKWDEARTAFASSIMVDTGLSSLAENLDGPKWPGHDKVDCPADYIDLDYGDAVALLDAHGYPAGTIDSLITILQETLAFDDPFGDMVEHSEAAAASNPLLENLEKLGIPADFPVEFTSLADGTKEFCKLENLSTLSEFAVFAHNMSQNAIVGGDFRELLNALSRVDEDAIVKFLPFRVGRKGLHLIEALGAVVVDMTPMERTVFAERGAVPSRQATEHTKRLVELFREDLASIEKRIAQGVPLSREVMVLEDPSNETLVVKLLESHVSGVVPEKKVGWLARLLGRG